MSSSPAYRFFNASLTPGQPPICDAIRGLLGMAIEGVGSRDDIRERDDCDEVVVVDAEVDGARYKLVRTSNVTAMRETRALAEPKPQLAMPKVAGTERRLNVGEFRRVLVAEHDRASRLGLQQKLQEWGFEVVTAKNGVDALSILEAQRPPELAIVSRGLPGIDGVELCRRINESGKENSPYVFIFARRNKRQEVMRALEVGAADYLTKPFDAGELRARLIVAARTLKRQRSLINSRDQFRAQARNDSLTGVWNRRAILENLEDELERGGCNKRSTGVLLVDLDHFKRVNDLYGHQAGDQVLRETGRRLKQALRSYDFIGRYGGEEFLIVVPGSTQSEVCELGERIRAAMERETIVAGQKKIRVTLSIGSTIAPACEKSASDVIAAADAALYKAKKTGRNRVSFGTRRFNWSFD